MTTGRINQVVNNQTSSSITTPSFLLFAASHSAVEIAAVNIKNFSGRVRLLKYYSLLRPNKAFKTKRFFLGALTALENICHLFFSKKSWQFFPLTRISFKQCFFNAGKQKSAVRRRIKVAFFQLHCLCNSVNGTRKIKLHLPN